MGRPIDGDALTALDRALGLAGSGTAVSELQDATLEQVIDVGPIVRRSRTIEPSEGMFTGVLRNIHPGAGNIFTCIRPYAAGAVAFAPFPAILSNRFELWLIGVSLNQSAGALTTIEASLFATNPLQAFGVDNLGAAVASTQTFTYARWNLIVDNPAFGTMQGVLGTDGAPWQSIGIRFPRINVPQLCFASVAGAACTFTLNILLGLFPISLGQDAAF